MKLVLFLLLINLAFSNIGSAQNLNMVIDVNDRLVTSQIAGSYLYFEYIDGTSSQISVGYHPGELILKKDIWKEIKSPDLKKITFKFNYYTYKKGNQKLASFEAEMKKYHFEKPYLILHVYDFRIENIERNMDV